MLADLSTSRGAAFSLSDLSFRAQKLTHILLCHIRSHIHLTLTESIMGDRTVLAPELFLIVLVVSSEAG